MLVQAVNSLKFNDKIPFATDSRIFLLNIIVNGRFMARAPSGVDRVGEELVRALAKLVADRHGKDTLQVLYPKGNVRLVKDVSATEGSMRGLIWEHFELPLKARNGLLLSPCNVGPLWHPRHALFIHDAQIFTVPQAYSWAFRAWYRLMLPKLARQAKLIVTVSNFSKAELEKYGVVPQGKAQVIYNGADHIDRVMPDPSVLTRHGLNVGGYFLAIGSLSPHKNLGMLIKARQAMPDGFPPLVIAGGGNSRIFANAGIGASANVRLLGRVTDGELKALYTNATAFLFPSLTEGFGLPPLEAMRCGCPVLASNEGAIPEICSDAVVSLSPWDQLSWIRAMVEIVSSQDKREKLRDAGMTRAANFTWSRAAQQLFDLLHEGTSNNAASGWR